MKTDTSSIQDEDDVYAPADSGATVTTPAAYNSLRKGGHVVLADRPCRIVDTKLFKVGKHGHGKVSVIGMDIFTNKRYETVQPSTHTAKVPIVTKKDFVLVAIGDMYMSVLDDKGILRSNIRVPDEPLAQEIKDRQNDHDETILITILSSMDKEKVISFKSIRD